MYNPILQFMKMISLCPYSDEEIMKKFQKEMHMFLSYYNLQHTRSGFIKACENRDTMFRLYELVQKQEDPETKRKFMDLLLAFIKVINAQSFC